MSDTAPDSPRPYVYGVPVMNITADHVRVGGNDEYAMLTVGPVEFYVPAASTAGPVKRREQLEAIQQLGAAIVGQASAALEVIDLAEAVAR